MCESHGLIVPVHVNTRETHTKPLAGVNEAHAAAGEVEEFYLKLESCTLPVQGLLSDDSQMIGR